MRPVSVVPRDEQREFTPQLPPVVGNDQPARALVLDGSDEPFDDRETAMFLDGTDALADATSLAPTPKVVIDELRALVGDQHTWTEVDPILWTVRRQS